MTIGLGLHHVGLDTSLNLHLLSLQECLIWIGWLLTLLLLRILLHDLLLTLRVHWRKVTLSVAHAVNCQHVGHRVSDVCHRHDAIHWAVLLKDLHLKLQRHLQRRHLFLFAASAEADVDRHVHVGVPDFWVNWDELVVQAHDLLFVDVLLV